MIQAFKSGLLMLAMMLLLVFIGSLIGGQTGATVFFVLALLMNFVMFFFSDRMVIAMYRARRAEPDRYSRLYSMLEELSHRAELPKVPDLYIVPMAIPNAFATGRSPSKAVVAVTEGLLNTLEPDEVMAVLAHEIGHIKNRDMLIQTIVAGMATAIMWLGNMAQWGAILGGRDDDENPGGLIGVLLISILGSVAATLIQMAISRSREYMADNYAAKLMGSGRPLMTSLMKLNNRSGHYLGEEIAPATAHMMIFPSGTGRLLANLFSTHPALDDRLKNLARFN